MSMESLIFPIEWHSKLYFMGFFLGLCLALPLSQISINNFAKSCENQCCNRLNQPFLVLSIIGASTVITPHFNAIMVLALILPLAWLLAFQANFQYRFMQHAQLELVSMVGVALLYAYINNTPMFDILLAFCVSLLLVAIYKINPDRKQYIENATNPYVIFTLIVSLGTANMGLFVSNLIKTIICFYLSKTGFYLYKSRRNTYTQSQIFVRFSELTKFYFLAWLVTILMINPHVYQSL